MNIKQIEQETGLNRANIRYYEKEGLLAPPRMENGYRDYSQQDVLTLSRIKLLRRLDIPVETIRQLQTGQTQMQPVLNQQLAQTQRRQDQLTRAAAVLQTMTRDGVTYASLQAEKYLSALDAPIPAPQQPSRDGRPDTASALARDIVAPYPWRRFFARGLDFSLYQLLFEAILYLLLGLHPLRAPAKTFVPLFGALALMALLEPLLLHFFGTTPGKALFGLRVEADDGGRLSLPAARARTRGVLFSGEGLYLPVVSLWRNWRCYRAYTQGEPLSWEYDSQQTLKDAASWRGWVYAGAVLMIGFSRLLVSLAALLPPHAAPLTTAAFAQNFNDLAAYYDLYPDKMLDQAAAWTDRPQYGGVTVYVGGDPVLPQITVTETDGVVTGVQLSICIDNCETWINSYQNPAMIAYLSFAGAHRPMNLLSFFYGKNIQRFNDAFDSFSFEQNGFQVDATCTYTGFDAAAYGDSGILFPQNLPNHFQWSFSIQRR